MFLSPLLNGVGSAAGAAVGSLGSLVPSQQEHENNQRLHELMMHRLGLTAGEKQAMAMQQAAPQQAIQQAGERMAGAELANAVGGGSGQALQRAGQQMQQTAESARQGAAAITNANQAKIASQQQEIEARLAAKAASGKERLDALGNIVTAGVSGVQKQQGNLATDPAAAVAPTAATALPMLTPQDVAAMRALPPEVQAELRARGFQF